MNRTSGCGYGLVGMFFGISGFERAKTLGLLLELSLALDLFDRRLFCTSKIGRRLFLVPLGASCFFAPPRPVRCLFSSRAHEA